MAQEPVGVPPPELLVPPELLPELDAVPELDPLPELLPLVWHCDAQLDCAQVPTASSADVQPEVILLWQLLAAEVLLPALQ